MYSVPSKSLLFYIALRGTIHVVAKEISHSAAFVAISGCTIRSS